MIRQAATSRAPCAPGVDIDSRTSSPGTATVRSHPIDYPGECVKIREPVGPSTREVRDGHLGITAHMLAGPREGKTILKAGPRNALRHSGIERQVGEQP
jgi:hypothetical protein